MNSCIVQLATRPNRMLMHQNKGPGKRALKTSGLLRSIDLFRLFKAFFSRAAWKPQLFSRLLAAFAARWRISKLFRRLFDRRHKRLRSPGNCDRDFRGQFTLGKQTNAILPPAKPGQQLSGLRDRSWPLPSRLLLSMNFWISCPGSLSA